jgi:hypothetical protein
MLFLFFFHLMAKKRNPQGLTLQCKQLQYHDLSGGHLHISNYISPTGHHTSSWSSTSNQTIIDLLRSSLLTYQSLPSYPGLWNCLQWNLSQSIPSCVYWAYCCWTPSFLVSWLIVMCRLLWCLSWVWIYLFVRPINGLSRLVWLLLSLRFQVFGLAKWEFDIWLIML